ncbi:UNVERIFIED_ORG: NIPSNAP protein [Burkholderia sp. CF145]|uniref:NIPSNAP family protein n=1 Tax=Paraburkholderia hospita TaxID=169430 RepID=UPI000271AD76|nr:NIPSNAP family protein [Paraburkholderia hospita]EUC18796.1 NIPSNAP family containing protein [Burkholderia sp. BT03]SKC60893.1 NIPSNAP protein [Paraburkholderia hospita]
MIIEHRTYKLKPGSLNEFLSTYETEGLAIQVGALGEMLGYFVSEVGHLNCVIHLWKFDSFEDRQSRRSKLWSAPEWKVLMTKLSPMILDQRSQLLTPAPFSPIR